MNISSGALLTTTINQSTSECILNAFQGWRKHHQQFITSLENHSSSSSSSSSLRENFKKPHPPVVVWILEHQYTEAGLSWSSLKGNDGILGHLLRSYNKRHDLPENEQFQLRLQLITRSECGDLEPGLFDDDDINYQLRAYDNLVEEFDEDAYRGPGLPPPTKAELAAAEIIEPEDYINLSLPSYDTDDKLCNEPDLTNWSIDFSSLLPNENILMHGKPFDQNVEPTGN
jgi:hypothetical protein